MDSRLNAIHSFLGASNLRVKSSNGVKFGGAIASSVLEGFGCFMLRIAVQIALLIMLTVTLIPILQYQAPADYAVCLTL